MANINSNEAVRISLPFHKLFSYRDCMDTVLMIMGTIGAIANGLPMPLMAIVLGDTIDAFGHSQDKDVVDVVSRASLNFVYLGIGAAIASLLQVACWTITGERQAVRIRALYLKTILRQDIAFFDKETNTGEVIGRMSGDTLLIQDAMGEKVGKFIQLVATFVAGFVIAFTKGWLLTLVMLSAFPLLVMAFAVTSIASAKMASRGQNAYAKAANVVEQTIGSIRTVASFTGERQAISNYMKLLDAAYISGVGGGTASGIGLGVVNLVLFCTYSLSVWFGGRMIVEKGYTGGNVLNVIAAVLVGSMSLGQASPSMTAFSAGQAAAHKMFQTIMRQPEIDAYGTTGMVLADIRGDVELRGVIFSYPARLEERIFDGLSLSIPSGITAALVGHSGSGKSTVISLIERFYDPQAGEVLIDGHNLKELQLKWIRSKIGLVGQEPVLFTASIRDNIAYGKDGATTEEIRAAAELANAATFIDRLPHGLDTMVGEHGTQLSGGQKQRIAIARAILKDPRILLLDEATSALDAESERVVQDALDRVMVNRTTVIIAHRLTTVRKANLIAVLHHGVIVEKGSHSELLRDSKGAYSQLIGLQEANTTKEAMEEHQRSGLYSGSESQSSQRNSFGHSSGPSVAENPKPEAERKDIAPKVPYARLAALNKPELPVLIAGSVAACGSGSIYPIYGILISKVLRTFYEPPHQLTTSLNFWALIFVALGFACIVVIPLQYYCFAVAGCKLIKRIRCLCFRKAVGMEIAWFDEPQHTSGAIGARLSADAATMSTLVGNTLSLLIQNLASAVAGVLISFYASWELALIIIALIPILGISSFLQMRFIHGFSADAKMAYQEASQIATDAVGNIRTVASFCAEEKVMQLYGNKCEGPLKAGLRRGIISGTGFGISFFMLFSVYATSFYVGAQLVKHGRASYADVFQVFFALSMAAVGISQSSSLAPDSSKAKSAVGSIFSIIDRNSKIDPSDQSGARIENVRGDIELRHVSFIYPSRPDIPIFRDLSLEIHCGKSVALVGESGSGKSTVIALLQRFYDPDSGHITLDGVEIQNLQLKWLRQQMGLVSQEPVLFNDTIRANIAYGKDGNATEAEIIAASQLANAHEFISSLQQGYDTLVGERGVMLSGGQKQRVAIARAIVKSPKILLLDEATSALDAESEKVVQDALDRVIVSRTTVVVAHRLSTIKNADVIAVVKNGGIVERGKHEALIKISNGFYASLAAPHMSASTS